MTAKPLFIRFTDAAVQPEQLPKDRNCVVRRVVGTVAMKNLLPLYHDAALGPDPRSARRNRVIDDILKSLSDAPEFFANKSKGILLGTANYKALERNRYRLAFEDPEVEGLIVPLVYGLQGLMEVRNGKVRWAVESPSSFVRKILPEIAGQYALVLELGKWDPQKIAKAPESHEFAVQQFRNVLRDK